MRKPNGTVLALAMMSVAVLFASPASLSSADTLKIQYEENPYIDVSFPYGRDIERGDDLVIVISSTKYDITSLGLMFYEIDSEGKINYTTSVQSYHYTISEGNKVTYTFLNMTKDIAIFFSDSNLVELDTPIIDDGGTGDTSATDTNTNNVTSDDLVTLLIAVSMTMAAVMLALILSTVRRIDSFTKDTDGAA
jgi:uncharacterized membrane protein